MGRKKLGQCCSASGIAGHGAAALGMLQPGRVTAALPQKNQEKASTFSFLSTSINPIHLLQVELLVDVYQ